MSDQAQGTDCAHSVILSSFRGLGRSIKGRAAAKGVELKLDQRLVEYNRNGGTLELHVSQACGGTSLILGMNDEAFQR